MKGSDGEWKDAPYPKGAPDDSVTSYRSFAVEDFSPEEGLRIHMPGEAPKSAASVIQPFEYEKPESGFYRDAEYWWPQKQHFRQSDADIQRWKADWVAEGVPADQVDTAIESLLHNGVTTVTTTQGPRTYSYVLGHQTRWVVSAEGKNE